MHAWDVAGLFLPKLRSDHLRHPRCRRRRLRPQPHRPPLQGIPPRPASPRWSAVTRRVGSPCHACSTLPLPMQWSSARAAGASAKSRRYEGLAPPRVAPSPADGGNGIVTVRARRFASSGSTPGDVGKLRNKFGDMAPRQRLQVHQLAQLAAIIGCLDEAKTHLEDRGGRIPRRLLARLAPRGRLAPTPPSPYRRRSGYRGARHPR